MRLSILILVILTLGACAQNGGSPTVQNSACLAAMSSSNRAIRNGDPDSRCEFANVLEVRVIASSGQNATCTGTLIAPTTVLTASHCFLDPSIAPARGAGVIMNGKLITARSFKTHPQFKADGTFGVDLALIFLPGETGLTPAKLATTEPPVNAIVRAAGYGLDGRGTNGDGGLGRLLVGTLKVLGTAPEADDPFFFVNGQRRRGILAQAATAARQETCVGDSGGPLFFNGEQTGVLSSGEYFGNGERCSDSKNSLYIPVAPFRGWIQQQINANAVR